MQCRHSHTTLAALWWRCSGDGWTHACTRASLITLIFNKIWALLNTHLNNSTIVYLQISLISIQRNIFIYNDCGEIHYNYT